MINNNFSSPSKRLAFRPATQDKLLVKLFGVTVTHTFYTLNDGLCGDFAIAPTPDSASLMASLGMAFRAERNGFGVYIEKGSRARLMAYLAAHRKKAGAGAGYWERLSFSLSLNNNAFVSITQLPLQTVTSEHNLYGGNRQAHADGATVLLNAGQYMDAQALYPVVGDELALELPPDAMHVAVRDISGAIVMPPDADPQHAIALYATRPGGPQYATVILRQLPYGLYTVCVSDAAYQPIGGGKYPLTVLYPAPQTASMAMLDLLFVQPDPAQGGVYPLSLPFERAPDEVFGCVQYQLAFEARHTCWQYFVVSRDAAGVLSQLRITGPDATFSQQAAPAILPDGSTAIVFQSASPLPLRQKSPLHFQLTGSRRDLHGHENPISVSRLPVAASAPVWPGRDTQCAAGVSEIFVYV